MYIYYISTVLYGTLPVMYRTKNQRSEVPMCVDITATLQRRSYVDSPVHRIFSSKLDTHKYRNGNFYRRKYSTCINYAIYIFLKKFLHNFHGKF